MIRLRHILVNALLIAAISLPVCLTSCSGPTTTIPETTKVLDEATLDSLSGASVNSSTLSFGNVTEQLSSLAVGDVIVCGVSNATPYGLLRKVTDINTDDSQMIVETINATLEDAIQECDISGTWSLLPDGSTVPLGTLASGSTKTGALSCDTNAQPDSTDGMNSAALADTCTGWYIDINDQVLFDLDKDLGTTNDQIVADGSLCADVRLDFGFKIKDWKLQEARFLLTTVETAQLEIMLQAGFASVREKLEVYRKWLKPFTIWVGIVPIVVAPVLTFNVGVDATASTGISTSITFTNDATVGVRYAGGAWSPVTDRSTSFEWGSPSLTAGCEVKGYVGPQLTLLLAGITGPYGEVRGYLDLEADLFETPWWKLYGGIEAAVGFRAEVLGHLIADYEVPAAIGYRLLLAQAESPVQQDMVLVQLKLLDIPSTLPFDQNFVPDNDLEYWWSINIDVDNNPDTGAYGYDVMIALAHWKQPDSTPNYASIIEGTEHNTWVYTGDHFTYGHEIDVTVDYASNTITMVASKAWEELTNLGENSRFEFDTVCYGPEGVDGDDTADARGSGVIYDPMGDGLYDFVDIIQGSLQIGSVP